MHETRDPKVSSPAQPPAGMRERRRPGRMETVSPALLPLLRGQHGTLPAAEPKQYGNPDQLTGIKGILAGLGMGLAGLLVCLAATWFFRF